MVEFGDEFLIESYRIPWLIWIQLAIMILLVLLLYFGLDIFDSDNSSAAGTAASAPPNPVDKPSTSHRRTHVQDDGKIRRDATAGTSGVSLIRAENGEDSSSLKESSVLLGSSHHPCSYIGLMRQAFLKCLGLDSSNSEQHDKKD